MVTRARAGRGARSRISTGIALSATELCAADIRLPNGSVHPWRAALEPPIGDGSWPSLANALSELARRLGVSDGTLVVSLMPPLTEVRRLELPPLRDDELQRLLTRNASRYFVNARGPQVVGVSRLGRRKRGGPAPVIAAASSMRLVAAIHTAAAQSGWIVDSVAPAETAWSAGARSLWPAFARDEAHLIVANDDRTDLLYLENGRLTGVRRYRAGAAEAGMIADALGPSARVGIAGPPAAREALSEPLARFGVRALMPAGEAAAIADRGDLLAAQFAGDSGGPFLRSEDATAEDHARSTKLAWTLAGIAAVLLLFSAGVELFGIKRQLRTVRAERAELRGQVAATLIGKTTLDATSRQLAALNGIDRASPRWSTIITRLSESVPREAYLTAIRVRQDSLIVDGMGAHAARVFDGLANTKGLVDVRAAAPVRREAQDDGPALEHFTIAARVRPWSEPRSTVAPAVDSQPKRPSP